MHLLFCLYFFGVSWGIVIYHESAMCTQYKNLTSHVRDVFPYTWLYLLLQSTLVLVSYLAHQRGLHRVEMNLQKYFPTTEPKTSQLQKCQGLFTEIPMTFLKPKSLFRESAETFWTSRVAAQLLAFLFSLDLLHSFSSSFKEAWIDSFLRVEWFSGM